MANALLDETRSRVIEVNLPMMKALRMSPTVETVLADEKPATMSWGDFALLGMLNLAITWRSSRGDVRGVTGLSVRLVQDAHNGTTAGTTSVVGPNETTDRKPPARAEGRR